MTPLCVASIHALSRSGDEPGDRVTVGRHRPHADAILDHLHIARRRKRARRPLQQTRRNAGAPRLRGRLDDGAVEVIGAEQQAAADVGAQVEARRVHHAMQGLGGA